MEKQKCEICNKEEYEQILRYDQYIKALERNSLDSEIRKKIEDFKIKEKKCIYVCDDCLKKIKGMNRIRTL